MSARLRTARPRRREPNSSPYKSLPKTFSHSSSVVLHRCDEAPYVLGCSRDDATTACAPEPTKPPCGDANPAERVRLYHPYLVKPSPIHPFTDSGHRRQGSFVGGIFLVPV